jgi:hypothetical protein
MKNLSSIFVVFGILALFLVIGLTPRTVPSIRVEPVAFNLSLAPIKIEEANVTGNVLQAFLKNDSDVPVTQIVGLLDCKNAEPLEVKFAEEFSEKDNRYVAVGLPVGESRAFTTKIPFNIDDESNCTFEIKYWSKYGE